MANELPPGTPEVDDAILLADLIQLLSIKGALGKMRVADIVLPVVNLGDVVQSTVEVRSPAFRSSDVFSGGVLAAPAAGAVMADTGQLVAGTYDVIFFCAGNSATLRSEAVSFEHRNSANAANLAVWPYQTAGAGTATLVWPQHSFAYEVGTNERLRAIKEQVSAAGSFMSAVIFARRRT